MKRKLSRAMEDTLMAYADGDLDETAAQRVRQWLAKDPDAAAALQRFEANLKLVRTSLDQPPETPVSRPAAFLRASRPRRAPRMALATAGAAVAVALALWMRPDAPVDVHSPAPEAVAALQKQLEAVSAQVKQLEEELSALRPVNAAQVEAEAQREEMAAILVAAAQRLDDSLGDHEGAAERYRYVLKVYPEARAAQTARDRLGPDSTEL